MSPRPNVDREEEILEAALRVFSKKGFDGSRTKEIADEAGLSEATIFKYFPSKRHLLLALTKPFIAKFVRPVLMEPIINRIHAEENKSIREILKMVLADRTLLFRTHGTLVGTLALEAVRHPDILEVFKNNLLPEIFGVIGHIFDIAKAKGEIRNIDTRVLARSLMSLLLGFILMSSAFPETMRIGDDSSEIDSILDVFIEGIKA